MKRLCEIEDEINNLIKVKKAKEKDIDALNAEVSDIDDDIEKLEIEYTILDQINEPTLSAQERSSSLCY